MDQDKLVNRHTFRTRGGMEIDFMIKLESSHIGIEVKNSDSIIDDDVRHLVLLKNKESFYKFFLFHFGQEEIKRNGIWCLPVGKGFQEIGL